MEVRGQLSGVVFYFHYLGSRDQTQVAGLVAGIFTYRANLLTLHRSESDDNYST